MIQLPISRRKEKQSEKTTISAQHRNRPSTSSAFCQALRSTPLCWYTANCLLPDYSRTFLQQFFPASLFPSLLEHFHYHIKHAVIFLILKQISFSPQSSPRHSLISLFPFITEELYNYIYHLQFSFSHFLLNPFQSSLWPDHSTDLIFVRVHSDLHFAKFNLRPYPPWPTPPFHSVGYSLLLKIFSSLGFQDVTSPGCLPISLAPLFQSLADSFSSPWLSKLWNAPGSVHGPLPSLISTDDSQICTSSLDFCPEPLTTVLSISTWMF